MDSKLKDEISRLNADAAVVKLNAYIESHPTDTDALTLRGMKHFGAGHRSEAINDYLAALAINPECSAKLALEAANNILNFYNKDLFNP